MFSELVTRIKEYQDKGLNFAIAQVVDREAPSSGKIGDKALILENGELIGWIGGGCVRGIVIKEAIEVIKTKRYRRVRISPNGGTSTSINFKQYVMSCQSEGTVELLIEPVFPQAEVIVVGKSNIARKLVALAATADFKVTAMANDVDHAIFPLAFEVLETIDFGSIKNFKNSYIIVTTQGENDDQAVLNALKTPAEYVGFVASKKKAERVKEYLISEGLEKERVSQLKSPVGLNLNAKLASEVAISILADIVNDFRNRAGIETSKESVPQNKDAKSTDAFAEEYYINPVCNVPVSKKNPKHIVQYQGENVYFCCDGCKVSFEKNPAQYMTTTD
ncbi:MAG: XdhC family protein [Bacteroidota bacterium]